MNNIYQFKYEAFSLTNVDGTSEKGTGLRYRCDVEAAVPEPCKLVVSVDNCALRHLDDIEEQTKLPRHDSSKDFDAAISQYDIIAHIDEGIVKKVLAHPEEQRHILNIKRGILNMISLNFEEGSEEVVERMTPCLSGNCSQIRRVVERRDGYETDVEVTRNLRKCENRPISGLWTSPLVWNVVSVVVFFVLFCFVFVFCFALFCLFVCFQNIRNGKFEANQDIMIGYHQDSN